MSNTALNALLQPMAITDGWLRVLAERALDPKGSFTTDSATTLANTDTQPPGVSVINVSGPLSKEPSLWAWLFGGTSYAGLKHEIAEAVEDGNRILLKFNSPGGEVYGCNELADFIHNACKAGAQIEAYIDGQGDSAAYWLASQCDRVTINASGEAGSIGVRCVVVDDSKAMEKAGVVAYDIVGDQSPLKVIDASDPKDRARVKAQMTAFAGVFVSAVARGRGVSIEKVLSDFGQGDVMVGQAAVDAGLADQVGTLESVLADMSANNGVNMKATANAAQGNPVPAATVGDKTCDGCDDDMENADSMYCRSCAKGGASASAFIASIGALLGATGEAAIVGAITGLKVQADKATALEAEIAGVRKAKAESEATALLDKACSDGRIAPAARATFEKLYAEHGVVALSASLSVLQPAAAPAIPATDEAAKEAANKAAPAPGAKTVQPTFTAEQLEIMKVTGVKPEDFMARRSALRSVTFQTEEK